jgi:hypothetical protein
VDKRKAGFFSALRKYMLRRSLLSDTPLGRAVQRYRNIAAMPVLLGPHHRYARI